MYILKSKSSEIRIPAHAPYKHYSYTNSKVIRTEKEDKLSCIVLLVIMALQDYKN
jgi:hypothetical protein